VIELTEPQVWVLIGVFAAGMFGMIGIVMSTFHRTLTSEIGGVRTEISSLRSEMRSEIGGLRAEMNVKFDALDRDIQALTRHVFGGESR
jgi:hypothetical protein